MKHWKIKNEKLLLDIQTKCGDITNEILNVAIDAERTFKCKWPKLKMFDFGKPKNPLAASKESDTYLADIEIKKKNWMDSILFEEWVQDFDKRFTKQKKKVALIIDNFPAHRKINDLTFIELIFLPPNTISKLQSMNKGVMCSLKAYSKSLALQRLLVAVDKGKEPPAFFDFGHNENPWFDMANKMWQVPPLLTVLWKQEFRKQKSDQLYGNDPSKGLWNKVEKLGDFNPPGTTAEDVISADFINRWKVHRRG